MTSAGPVTPRLRPPAHILLPPPPSFSAFSGSSPDHSPLYYTAPSSPASPPDLPYFTPPSSPAPITTNDPCPAVDLTIDVALDDDSLTALDKIYLFTTSKATSHRVFITHALPSFLPLVTPHDAIHYVLPLLSGLAMDQEEQVKEALAAELVSLIWWFFSHCQIVSDEVPPTDPTMSSETATISVQAFTPILGTLLLSSNPAVGATARYAIVDLLSRLKTADEKEAGADFSSHSVSLYEEETDWAIGLFLRYEREIFRNEILQQIVIGMARLDVDVDDLPDEGQQDEQSHEPNNSRCQDCTVIPAASDIQFLASRSEAETHNPFFPPFLPHPSLSPSAPASLAPSWSCWPDRSGPLSPMASAKTENRCISKSETLSPGVPVPHPIHTNPPFPRSPTEEHLSSPHSPPSHSNDDREFEANESELDEHGAVGRLSSMSLMAAVTASGPLDGSIQEAFVKEVERGGQDPVYWVRREAVFALGALAKVIPEEIVICSFLPLFDSLRHDSVWHVRHSALFALPAILSRLPPMQRRSLALDTISTLCMDDSPVVRSGVLEALGEVLYTFHKDDDGPPEKLLQLFLGRKEDKRVRDGQQISVTRSTAREETPLESFYKDSERPLICAFNYPAVALTLGRARWPELREVYRDLAANRALRVQQTIAASLGVLAEIIGKENANVDLVDVWWDVIRNDDNEVRAKALESVGLFVSVLGTETGDNILRGLVSAWDEGILNSWRERETITTSLMTFINSTTVRAHSFTVGLLRRGLEDVVAAVREAAVSALPRIWSTLSNNQEVLIQLKEDLRNLSNSRVYRRRMTFVACQQALLTFEYDGHGIGVDEDFWDSLSKLVDDPIIGVRIGIARLTGYLSAQQLSHHHFPTSGKLLHLIERLSQDASCEVRSYLPSLSQVGPPLTNHHFARSDLIMSDSARIRMANPLTFSRPPPARMS